MIRANPVEEFMPPGDNPFWHDHFSMGTQIASNVWIMHPTHPSEATGEIYIVNSITGERMRIDFVEQTEKAWTGHVLREG